MARLTRAEGAMLLAMLTWWMVQQPVAPAQVAQAAVAVCHSWSPPARLLCLERTADWLAERAATPADEAARRDTARLLLQLWDQDGVATKAGIGWLIAHEPAALDGRLEMGALLKTSFFWRQASADVADLLAPGLSDFSGLLWQAWRGPGLPPPAAAAQGASR